MNKIRTVISGVVVASIIVTSTNSARAHSLTKAQSIEAYTANALEKYHIPGASLFVQKDGKKLVEKSWGVSSDSKAITADTPFLIGSLSKSVTALAIMQLAQDGRINLNEPISKYIPDFQYDSPNNTPILVRHLLEHTSGISALDGLNVTDRNYSADGGIKQAVNALDGAKLESNPGDTYTYTSANYLLLGEIIESTSGKTYADFVDSRIFTPLDMHKSSANQKATAQSGLVPGYSSWFGQAVKVPSFYDNAGAPYGYIASTVNDLTKFLDFMKNGNEAVLSKSGLDRLKEKPQEDRSYGFGWHYSKQDKYYNHGGATPEYRAEMFYYPDRDFYGVLLTNKYHSLEDQQVSDITSGVRAIAQGESPKELPKQSHLEVWGIWGAALVFIGLFGANLVTIFRKTMKRSNLRLFFGVVSLMFAIILFMTVPYIFGAPWHSIFLFAPDVGYGSATLVIVAALNAVAYLFTSKILETKR